MCTRNNVSYDIKSSLHTKGNYIIRPYDNAKNDHTGHIPLSIITSVIFTDQNIIAV